MHEKNLRRVIVSRVLFRVLILHNRRRGKLLFYHNITFTTQALRLNNNAHTFNFLLRRREKRRPNAPCNYALVYNILYIMYTAHVRICYTYRYCHLLLLLFYFLARLINLE